MRRRNFLTLVGGGIVLAAGGSVAAIVTRKPTQALEPWEAAGETYSDLRMRALSYAVLSPNPHNRQPWKADLSTPGAIRLFVDTERLLPHTDPFNRQITIGLGCFIETLSLAAAQDGHRADVVLFPQGSSPEALDTRPVAEISLLEDKSIKPDPLFAHVLDRRSVKEPYDLSKPVADAPLVALKNSANHGTSFEVSNASEQVAVLRQITLDALMIELNTPRTYKESVDLMRIGKAEIEANPDGIDFSGPLFETLHLTGMMTREGLLDPTSSMFEQGKTALAENALTGMAYIWQTTQGNTRSSQIGAGRDWMRMHLMATREGLSLQPMSQALQEFPEMSELYQEAHSLLAPEDHTLQMLARLGYAQPVAASPRWPLEAKLMKA